MAFGFSAWALGTIVVVVAVVGAAPTAASVDSVCSLFSMYSDKEMPLFRREKIEYSTIVIFFFSKVKRKNLCKVKWGKSDLGVNQYFVLFFHYHSSMKKTEMFKLLLY